MWSLAVPAGGAGGRGRSRPFERNIGARGLRAVMEGLLTRIMYEIPSDPTITRVTITPEAVLKDRRAGDHP